MVWSKIIQITILFVSFFAATFIYKRWPHIKQDNIIEEKIEYYLESYTGFDIDLSPESRETNGNNKRIK